MTPKTQEYLDQIKTILDQASEDDALSVSDYEELCQAVIDDASERTDEGVGYEDDSLDISDMG